MTAIRVIDDHLDLENIGTTTHQQLDDYIDNTRWLIGPGSNPIPPSSLTISAGDGISITSSGNQLIVQNTAIGVGVTWSLMETPAGIVDNSNLNYTLSAVPQPANSLMLFVNGVLQVPGPEDDYVLSGNVITLTQPALLNSKISAAYSYTSTMGVLWSFLETPSGDIDDVNANFVLNNAPHPQHALMLFVNGVLQVQGVHADYVLSGKNITLTSPPLLGSKVVATYSYLSMGTRISWMEQPFGEVDGVNMIFDLAYVPNPASRLMFFVNGILQRQNEDYDLTANSVMLYSAPFESSNLVAIYQY